MPRVSLICTQFLFGIGLNKSYKLDSLLNSPCPRRLLIKFLYLEIPLCLRRHRLGLFPEYKAIWHLRRTPWSLTPSLSSSKIIQSRHLRSSKKFNTSPLQAIPLFIPMDLCDLSNPSLPHDTPHVSRYHKLGFLLPFGDADLPLSLSFLAFASIQVADVFIPSLSYRNYQLI